ncbi:MAG: RNA polymerase sigma factor [Oscillospiraceae bacterium]|nr:RNA polymerase sigma factor [Oscillospiraceae bacterium]
MNNTISDEEIVERYTLRDDAALDYSIKIYGKRLLCLASSFLSDTRDAEECVNDTFLKAWNSIPPQKPQDLFSFLARLCRCTAYDIIKKNNAAKRSAQIVELTREMEECIPDKMSETWLSEKALADIINDFLKTLSEEHRVIFVRHYWFGEPVSVIAETYHFSKSKVKTTLHRSREKLKVFLSEKGASL